MIEPLSPEEQKELKSIQTVFAVIAGFLFFFLLGSIVFCQARGPLMPELKGYESWLLGGAAVLSFFLAIQGKMRFNREVGTAKSSLKPLVEKLSGYRAALIIYLATTELPVIICIILSVLTGNFVFQVYAAVLLGFMLSARPGREKVLGHLGYS